MLQSIRDKSSGWIAFIILGLVIITMAFFGIESYFAPKVETFSARIEGPAKFLGFGGQSVDISQQQFRGRFEQVRAQERERQGDAFDSAAFESIDNKRRVLDQMVDEEILALVAARDGITVSEAEVAAQLKAMPQFQVNGVYSADQYKLALAGQGQTHAQFMARMRAEMARQALPNEIVDTAVAGEGELEAFLKLSQQTRDVQLIDLPTPSLPAKAPTDAELRAWYDANVSAYRTPEQVAIEYVEIDASTLPPPAAPDEATLRQRYAEQRARFVTEPQRSASHILVAVPADAGPAADADARTRAAALVTRARAPGADFAAIAREASDDLGSKADGGALGVVEPGLFDPSFEKALFALTQPGEVSEPVRTPDGWHVIQLTAITPGSERAFEDVRDELEAQYLETEKERAFADRAGRLLELIYRTPTALEPAAKELGLELRRTGLFTRTTGEGIAAIEDVRRAAFSDNQRIERQVSDTLEIGPGHVVAIHVIEHQPEAAQPFEQVRERVRADFDADRLAQASQAQAAKLLERARKGETLEAIAAEVGRTVAPLPGIGRQAQLPPALVQSVFATPAPTADAPAYGIARVGSDRHVLFQVTAVGEGDLSTLDDATRRMLLEQLARARGLVEFEDYMKALRAGYEITVAEDRL
jgi:peptidyl-prolyl cis-trans isomerase D